MLQSSHEEAIKRVQRLHCKPCLAATSNQAAAERCVRCQCVDITTEDDGVDIVRSRSRSRSIPTGRVKDRRATVSARSNSSEERNRRLLLACKVTG